MTRARLTVFVVFVVAGVAAVAAFAIIDRTVGEIALTVVLGLFGAYAIGRVVRYNRENK